MIPIPDYENYAVTESGDVYNLKTGKRLTRSLNENGYWYVSLWKNNKQQSRTVHRLVATAYIPNPDNKPVVNHKDADRSHCHAANLEWVTQSENVKHSYLLGNKAAKKHFPDSELDWIIEQVLSGKTLTGLAEQLGVGLSRLSVNLRVRASQTKRLAEYESVLRAQKNFRNKQANTTKCVPIAQFNDNGEELARFPSATAAARALGKSSSGSICNALNPETKQTKAFGYIWKYI